MNLPLLEILDEFFVIEPGSRFGTAKDMTMLRWGDCALAIAKGEACEINQNNISAYSSKYCYPGLYKYAQLELVHKTGDEVFSAECLSRSPWGANNRPSRNHESIAEQIKEVHL